MIFQELPIEDQRILKKAFQNQRRGSESRKIDFLMSFEEWIDFWLICDRYKHRGAGKNQLQMCRFGDIGPYHRDNVYCASGKENSRINGLRKRPLTDEHWMRRRQGKHGRLRPRAVATPKGHFVSLSDAARHHDLRKSTVHYLVNSANPNWTYL